LAENILKKVKPGSIILLHDGIDGNIGADRSVVLGALPLILQGLKERGLTPVTLDKLLNVPAYLPSCS
jgi:peptidoglycan/xylan/chitin deacetylase (PgdA/CDA1 family)